MTIDELKARGYRVFVSHQRPIVAEGTPFDGMVLTRFGLERLRDEEPGDFRHSERGGLTVVQITRTHGPQESAFRPQGDVIARGEARCHPGDNYHKRLGLTIALGRACKALEGSE